MKLRSTIMLLITATVWGVAFVAQDVGMDYVSPFVFNGMRCLIGALALIPVIFFRDRVQEGAKKTWKNKTLWIGGVLCGAALCIASNLQQTGIKLSEESVGKAGFITATYIVIVPIIGVIFGKKSAPTLWCAVAAALGGLYLLCVPEGVGFAFSFSDALLFLCAFVFAGHILIIDRFSPKVDGVRMACIQFFICGMLSWLGALVTRENVDFKLVSEAWLPIAYAGIMSCGVGYTLQIVGQKGLNPTFASIIMSLESCISVIAAWILQNKAMSGRQMVGCGVMFAAILLAQMPVKGKETKKA